MKRHFVYPAIFHPEETGFSVFFPDLKGCQTQGENLEESTIMAQEALGAYLECFAEDDRSIPASSLPKDLVVKDDDFVAMISVDIVVFKEKLNNKAIKKTLTIPAWLNNEAEKQHINFSSVLKEALIERISE